MCNTIDGLLSSGLSDYNAAVDDGNTSTFDDIESKLTEYYDVTTDDNGNITSQTLVNIFTEVNSAITERINDMNADINTVVSQINSIDSLDDPDSIDVP